MSFHARFLRVVPPCVPLAFRVGIAAISGGYFFEHSCVFPGLAALVGIGTVVLGRPREGIAILRASGLYVFGWETTKRAAVEREVEKFAESLKDLGRTMQEKTERMRKEMDRRGPMFPSPWPTSPAK